MIKLVLMQFYNSLGSPLKAFAVLGKLLGGGGQNPFLSLRKEAKRNIASPESVAHIP